MENDLKFLLTFGDKKTLKTLFFKRRTFKIEMRREIASIKATSIRRAT